MIWEIDDKQKVIEGLDEDGNPDPEYAVRLGLKPAPYGRRAVASIIEFALYGLLLSPYAIFVVPYFVRIMTGMLDWYGFVQHPRFILLLLIGLFSNLLVIAFVIVQVTLHGKKGVTIGKAFTGIRSVNVKTLEAPGFWRAAWRAVLMYLTFLIPVIGPALFFASPFFDQQRRRRGWLDYAGGTWFVDIKHGLNPYDRKRMRIARKNAKVELNDAEEQLPSLATEADVRSEPRQYVPSARVSRGVLGASVPDPGQSPPSTPSPSVPSVQESQFARPPAREQHAASAAASAPVASQEAGTVPAPSQEPYLPGTLSGRPAERPPVGQGPPSAPTAAPPVSGARPPVAQPSVPHSPTVQPPANGQGYPAQTSPASAPPAAPPSAPPVDGDTVMHGAAPAGGLDDDVAATRVAHRRQKSVATISLDTGETFELEGSALLGRNPRPGSDENIVHALPIADPSQSISKTHLLLEVNGSKVFVVDRHSTNGSSLERSGQVVTLPPGHRVELFSGDIVRFGDRSLQIRLP